MGLTLSFSLSLALAGQTVHHVDAGAAQGGNGSAGAPLSSIQAAIVIAAAGDSIVVAPGTYFETVDFLGKSIEVRSLSGATGTIINGGNTAVVVKFVSAETALAVLEGFTITGGYGSSTFAAFNPHPGGILVEQASPTIRRCIIAANHGADTMLANVGLPQYGGAGGVALYSSVAVIEDCIIENNVAGGHSAPGGIEIRGGAPLLLRNRVRANLASGGGSVGSSGGILAKNWATPLIESCRIEANTGTGNYPGGIAIGWSAAPVTIRSTSISMNRGGDSLSTPLGTTPGGIGALLASTPFSNVTLAHCTIAGNIGGIGSDPLNTVVASNGAVVSIDASVVWDNRNDLGQTVGVGAINAAAPVVTRSDVEGGYLGVGNIDLLPVFRAPAAGDFGLAAGSPCIDLIPGPPLTPNDVDDEGDPRLFYDLIDIGADEYISAAWRGSALHEHDLLVNQEDGGHDRRIEAGHSEALTIAVGSSSQPPTDFVLFARSGGASRVGEWMSPFGGLIFTPASAVTGGDAIPLFSSIPGIGLFAATPTTWQFIVPNGIPFPAVFSLQSVQIDLTAAVNVVTISNGILIDLM